MAMLDLAVRQVAPRWSLCAVTVDHRLRPEAAEEAAFVGRRCAEIGIQHDVLIWEHGEVKGNLMQAASAARYGLMAAWAARRGVTCVLVAHTADDQAETFLMGLARSAGLDGLSGMRPSFHVDGVRFARPLLRQTRQGLREHLARHRLTWVDDPTNENPEYTRVKARRSLAALAPLGIDVRNLTEVIYNLAAARAALHAAAVKAASRIVQEKAGALMVERQAFQACEPEVRRRLLIGMVQWIGGGRHAPRESKVAALMQAVDANRDATLAGVRFRNRGDHYIVSREARACGPAVQPGEVWDGRWRLTGGEGEVRALGPEGLRQCPDWRKTGLSRQSLEVTPGLWQEDRLIAAPCAGFGPAAATLTASFSLFLLSH